MAHLMAASRASATREKRGIEEMAAARRGINRKASASKKYHQ